MSWNKATANCSEVDAIIKVLKELGVPFEVQVIGSVRDMSLGASYEDHPVMRPLRRLSYANKVVLEKIHRTWDCDEDDTICSVSFDADKEPQDWKTEDWEIDEELGGCSLDGHSEEDVQDDSEGG